MLQSLANSLPPSFDIAIAISSPLASLFSLLCCACHSRVVISTGKISLHHCHLSMEKSLSVTITPARYSVGTDMNLLLKTYKAWKGSNVNFQNLCFFFLIFFWVNLWVCCFLFWVWFQIELRLWFELCCVVEEKLWALLLLIWVRKIWC